jgi:DNA helicase HerA-like ATPase
MSDTLFIGGGGPAHDRAQALLLNRANRHGLVAGATGTGKTVTLQILAEGFSAAGVPVFAADVKGDLSGIAAAGDPAHKLHDKLQARAAQIGMGTLTYAATPTVFWDLYGEKGHPVRTTIAEMGPLLLSRLMGLSDVQEGALTIAFEYAEDNDLLLLDTKDLRKLVAHLGQKDVAAEVSRTYGNLAPATIGAIQRGLLVLEREGADLFFGEPALELSDLMRTAPDGRGVVSILDATRLINSPKLYSTFLLWLLSELFEQLPEVGDPDKPRLVFVFDEAHLLFADAPKALLDKIDQVVKLIRSKGVGVYFVTQNPRDLPESVLAQLGNRIQHALRAYTPTERKAVKSAADSFRPNPEFSTEATITELGTGEALVSTLDAKGAPSQVQRTLVRPPSSRLGPLTDAERKAIITASPVLGKYDKTIDRESAYERLAEREEQAAKDAEKLAKEEARLKEQADKAKARKSTGSRRQGVLETAGKQAARSITREVTRYILRGIMGGRKR